MSASAIPRLTRVYPRDSRRYSSRGVNLNEDQSAGVSALALATSTFLIREIRLAIIPDRFRASAFSRPDRFASYFSRHIAIARDTHYRDRTADITFIEQSMSTRSRRPPRASGGGGAEGKGARVIKIRRSFGKTPRGRELSRCASE